MYIHSRIKKNNKKKLQNEKIKYSIIVFTIIISVFLHAFADDEIDEYEISQEEIYEITETSGSVTNVPSINSRYAVCYDRVSRGNTIW